MLLCCCCALLLLGGLAVTHVFRDLSVRVSTDLGSQLTVERLTRLSDRQELARQRYGRGVVYFAIAHKDGNVHAAVCHADIMSWRHHHVPLAFT